MEKRVLGGLTEKNTFERAVLHCPQERELGNVTKLKSGVLGPSPGSAV